MNLLIVGKFSVEHFAFHIADSLCMMGHNAIEFEATLKDKYYKNVLLRRIHQANNLINDALTNFQLFRATRKKKIRRILDLNKIDLIILTHDFLYPDEIALIKSITKAPIVLWFPDSAANFGKAFFIIADYDYLFFQDPYIVTILNNQYDKKNVFYLPECCNPKYHKRILLTHEDYEKFGCDLSTFGSAHNFRSLLFSKLFEKGYKIKIWGHPPSMWQTDNMIKSIYTGEYVTDINKCKAVLATKININSLIPSGVFGLNARTFEIAGIGGFQLIHWRRGLSALFEDGNEVVSFNTFADLIEKINFYLDNADERNKIALAGQKRALAHHTYVNRLDLIFETVFGSAKGYEMPEITL